MEFSISSLLLLMLAALAAGVVNSLAGGGTLLTFPALTAALAAAHGPDDAKVWANATSTVALVPGALAGAWGYRREVAAARKWLTLLAGPSLLGGCIGSLLLTRMDPHYFSIVVPWLLLGAAVIFLYDTVRKRPQLQPAAAAPPRSAVAGLVLFQFGVGIYGGYFGAGIGILMLGALALMGIGDIHRMNSLKTLLNACINGVSVVIFIHDGKVEWRYALPMAVAAMVGGYLGARLALRVKPKSVRWIVIAIGFGLAAHYFSH